MAKKIVRGITDVKTITNQDFDTNNVNDLLSDGQYNYIHRKKGKNEEYHNLTDNIKTISSDNTELLSVTNYNKTTNTATLHPKHDAQKEQVLESTRNTVSIHHGTNGTAEKTTVDTNPQKVLEHENLQTDYGISKNTTGNTTKLGLEYTKADNLDLNELENGRIRGANLLNAPSNEFYFVDSYTEYNYCIQEAIKLTDYLNTTYRRLKNNGVWGEWREQVGDKSVIDGLLAQKEQVLESTRNTVTIRHATNGTAEKTTVDTNPQKVLEHENLISDSEYITLDHETDVNKTHIKTESLKQELQQLHQTKQDTLIAGYGITIEKNVISSTGSATIQVFEDTNFTAYGHRVETSEGVLLTLSFECYNAAETVLTGDLKQQLALYVLPNTSISNSTITISNDGTNMKLINSLPSENVIQHATFTFTGNTDS